MSRNLLTSFCLLLVLLSWDNPLMAQGRSIPTSSAVREQQQQEQEATVETPLPEGQKYRYPLLNGLSLSINVFDPMLKMFKVNHANYEAMATLDLHHRFMPEVAVGLGQGNDLKDIGIRYRVKSTPYIKLGMAYNLKYNQQIRPYDWYGVFMRYGCSKSTADITGLTYTDGYWEDYGPHDLFNQEYKCHWLEMGACLRVLVWQRLSMGWDVYFRPMIRKAGNEYGDPYFVPGYGVTNVKIGFQFHVLYKIF